MVIDCKSKNTIIEIFIFIMSIIGSMLSVLSYKIAFVLNAINNMACIVYFIYILNARVLGLQQFMFMIINFYAIYLYFIEHNQFIYT